MRGLQYSVNTPLCNRMSSASPFQMAALYEDCPNAGFRDAQRRLSHLLRGFDCDASQFRGLGEIRCDQRGVRQEKC